MTEGTTVWIRATVIAQQESCLIVHLDDGFANAEAKVHIDNTAQAI